MEASFIYTTSGIGLVSLGLYALVIQPQLLRKILALNIMGNGVFLVLVAPGTGYVLNQPDPVPHAMVITGIVVAVSATALALALLIKVLTETGRVVFSEDSNNEHQKSHAK